MHKSTLMDAWKATVYWRLVMAFVFVPVFSFYSLPVLRAVDPKWYDAIDSLGVLPVLAALLVLALLSGYVIGGLLSLVFSRPEMFDIDAESTNRRFAVAGVIAFALGLFFAISVLMLPHLKGSVSGFVFFISWSLLMFLALAAMMRALVHFVFKGVQMETPVSPADAAVELTALLPTTPSA